MTPAENIALFEAIKAQAETAAVPAVEKMAEHFEGDVRRVLSLDRARADACGCPALPGVRRLLQGHSRCPAGSRQRGPARQA